MNAKEMIEAVIRGSSAASIIQEFGGRRKVPKRIEKTVLQSFDHMGIDLVPRGPGSYEFEVSRPGSLKRALLQAGYTTTYAKDVYQKSYEGAVVLVDLKRKTVTIWKQPK